MMEITFSVNSYDSDGDVMEEAVFLHFENTCIRVCDSANDFQKICDNIVRINEEIKRYHTKKES
jgi:hypothetical protein